MAASISAPNEQELLLRLVAGDRYAFECLYRHYSNRIYGRLLKLTQSEQLADELLQDTFVRLWEKRSTINPELSFKSWLYKVAENEVFLFYRKLARDKRLQEYVVQHFTEAYSHTEEAIYLAESRELLHSAMGELSPQRKEVFTLCKLEGKSYEEAARIMGISPATVSNHLVKAMQVIRQYVFRTKEYSALIAAVFLLSDR